jgi:acetyl-CoA C-acetyltransferase
MDMQPTTRPVAVLGGNRIPFARSNTVYSGVSNQEMLTAAIDGLVDRFELRGERLGEVVAGGTDTSRSRRSRSATSCARS